MAKAPKRKRISKGRPKAARDIPATPCDLVPVRRQGATVEGENQRLRNHVAELEQVLERLQTERVGAVVQGSDGDRLLAQQFVATELQHGDLASLYVASTRLQATLRKQEVLAAIREIVINLIGVEEMAVFENHPRTSTLSLIDYYGNGWANHSSIPVGEGPIGRVALTGDCYFHDVKGTGREPGNANMPTACVPLKVDGVAWGVIVILRLLPQKDRLVALDYQLLDLLSTQAGIALHCAELSAERAAAREIMA
jgi:GAF domain-containing protein